MADFPALPLWTDAYLADCGHLTFAESGAYLALLMLMWRSPDCRVPNDPAWLKRRLRISSDDDMAALMRVVSEFCQNDGNCITQKRLLQERDYLQKKAKKNSESAKSRWNKENTTCERNASTQCERNAPTPTPTPLIPPYAPPEGGADAGRKKSGAGSRLPDDWQPNAEERQYAVAQGVDPDRTATDFRDYWIAKAGQGARKADWGRTWQRWCREAADRQRGRSHRTGGNATTTAEIHPQNAERIKAAAEENSRQFATARAEAERRARERYGSVSATTPPDAPEKLMGGPFPVDGEGYKQEGMAA